MVKHTLKILRSEHRKIFEVRLSIFQHYLWKGWMASLQSSDIMTVISQQLMGNTPL